MSKTLTRKIAEGTAIYSIGGIIINIINFLTVYFLINALGKYEYGVLTLLLSVFVMITLFLDIGSVSLIPTEISRYKDKNPGFAKNIIKEFAVQQMIFAVILSFVLFFISFFVKQWYDAFIMKLLWIVSLMIILKAIDNIMSVTFYGLLKYKLHQTKEISISLIKCFLAFLVMIMNKGLLITIIIYPISMFLSIIIFLHFFIKIYNSMHSEKNTKNILFNIYKKQGKFVIATIPLKKIMFETPIWIVKYLLGVEAVAIFSVAQKVIQVFQGFLNSLNRILFTIVSEIYSKDKSKIKIINNRSIKYILYISIICFIFSFILIPVLFKYIFPEYIEAIILIKLLIFIFFCIPFIVILGPSFYALRKQKYIFYSLIIVIPPFLIFFYIATYFFGLIGSSIIWVLGTFTLVIIQYKYLIKLEPTLRISIKDLYIIDNYDKKLVRNIYKSIKVIIHKQN